MIIFNTLLLFAALLQKYLKTHRQIFILFIWTIINPSCGISLDNRNIKFCNLQCKNLVESVKQWFEERDRKKSVLIWDFFSPSYELWCSDNLSFFKISFITTLLNHQNKMKNCTDSAKKETYCAFIHFSHSCQLSFLSLSIMSLLLSGS